MGKEAQQRRRRACDFCKEEFYTDAAGLKEHADYCARMAVLGLITPQIILDRPGLTITRGG